MAEAESVGPGSGGTAGVGKGLNYVGKHATATSGIIAVGSAGVGTYSTLLSFSTQSSYVVAEFQFFRGLSGASGNDYNWRLSINGEIVMEFDDTAGDRMEYPIHLIIPPYAVIEVTAANVSTTTNTNLTAIITGRVYDA